MENHNFYSGGMSRRSHLENSFYVYHPRDKKEHDSVVDNSSMRGGKECYGQKKVKEIKSKELKKSNTTKEVFSQSTGQEKRDCTSSYAVHCSSSSKELSGKNRIGHHSPVHQYLKLDSTDNHYMLTAPVVPKGMKVPEAKAADIALMEEGIMESDKNNVFIVHSLSENYRIVDMWTCSCSCPAGERGIVCSHLYAVGMRSLELGFRVSLFTFVREKIERALSSHINESLTLENLASWVLKNFFAHVYHTSEMTFLFSWLLKSFCGLLGRSIQNKTSRLPMILINSNMYNESSDEEGHKKIGCDRDNDLRFTFKMNVLLKKIKNASALDVVDRFILFFKTLGRKYYCAVESLNLLKKMAARSKEVNCHRSSEDSVEVLDSLACTLENDLSETERHDMNCQCVLDWLKSFVNKSSAVKHKKEKRESGTQTACSIVSYGVSDSCHETGTGPLSSSEVEEIASMIVELSGRHTTVLSLLHEVSDVWNKKNKDTQVVFQQGICETLAPLEGTFSALKNLSVLGFHGRVSLIANETVQEMQEAVDRWLETPDGDMIDSLDRISSVMNYLNLPKSLDRFGLSLETNSSNSRMKCGTSRFAHLPRLKSFLTSFCGLEKKKDDLFSMASSYQVMQRAINLLFQAPCGIDLAKYMMWRSRFQTVLYSFDDFLFNHAQFSGKLDGFCFVEVEYSVFIKLPKESNDASSWVVNLEKFCCTESLVEAWGLCFSVLWHKPCSKKYLEDQLKRFRSASSIPWFVLHQFYGWIPYSLYPVVEWFLTFWTSHKPISLTQSECPGVHACGVSKEGPEVANWVKVEMDVLPTKEFNGEVVKPMTQEGLDSALRLERFDVDYDGYGEDPPELSREDWEDVIRSIRKNQFGISDDKTDWTTLEKIQNERLSRALQKLSLDLYSSRTHFLLEMLQNADDNIYPQRMKVCHLNGQETQPALCLVSLMEGVAWINNEKGLTQDDLRVLCDIGMSSKGTCEDNLTRKRIGKFGIGFKSVFSYTPCPCIFSKNLAFQFNLQSDVGIGALLPQSLSEDWNTFCPHVLSEIVSHSGISPSTVVWLPHDQKHLEDESLWLNCVNTFSPLWCLFLNQLETFKIYDVPTQTYLTIHRRRLHNPRPKSFTGDGEDCPTLALEFQHIVLDVKRGTYSLGQSGVETIILESHEMHFLAQQDTLHNLSVAYPFDPVSYSPLLSPHFLYVYLPLQQVGLQFPVHGEFLITAARESIVIDDPGNVQRLHHLGILIGSSLAALANEIHLSFLRFIPVESELIDGFKPLCKIIRRQLYGRLKVKLLALEPCYGILEDRSFLIPLYPELDQSLNNGVSLDDPVWEDKALHGLFCSVVNFKFHLYPSSVHATSQVVSMDFVQEATLDVCRRRLCFSDFGLWNLVDCLIQHERFLKYHQETLSREQLTLCGAFVGATFIMLTQLALVQNKDLIPVIDAIRALSIFPVYCPSLDACASRPVSFCNLLGEPSRDVLMEGKRPFFIIHRGKDLMGEGLSHEKLFLPFLAKHCRLLDDSLFHWTDLPEMVGSKEFIHHEGNAWSWKMNRRLVDVLKRFSIFSVMDSDIMSNFFFSFLRFPAATCHDELILALCFVLVQCKNQVERLLVSAEHSRLPELQRFEEQLSETHIVLEREKGTRKLGSKCFLTLCGEQQRRNISECLKQILDQHSAEKHYATCSVLLHSRLVSRYAFPCQKYWRTVDDLKPEFWNAFFSFWGAKSFWAVEPIHYRVDFYGTSEATVVLMHSPAYWSKEDRESVERLLHMEASMSRFRDISLETMNGSQLFVDDFICVEFLILCELLEKINSFDSLTHLDGCVLQDCLVEVYQALIPSSLSQCDATVRCQTSVSSILVVQLRHSCWIPCSSPSHRSLEMTDLECVERFMQNTHRNVSSSLQFCRSLDVLMYTPENNLLSQYCRCFTHEPCFHVMSEYWFSKLYPSPSSDVYREFYHLLQVNASMPLCTVLKTMISLASLIEQISTQTMKLLPSTLARPETLVALVEVYWLTLTQLASVYATACSLPEKDPSLSFFSGESRDLFYCEKCCLVYDKHTKTWKAVAGRCVYYSLDQLYPQEDFLSVFSIKTCTIQPLHEVHDMGSDSTRDRPGENRKAEDKLVKQLFTKCFNIPEHQTVRHLVDELEFLETRWMDYSKLIDGAEQDIWIRHVIHCLYILYLQCHDQEKLTVYDHVEKGLESSDQMCYPSDFERILNEKNLKIFPVKTLDGALVFLNLQEISGSWNVRLCITDQDKKIFNALTRKSNQENPSIPLRIVCGAYHLASSSPIVDKRVQCWWDTFLVTTLRSAPLSGCYTLVYGGNEPIHPLDTSFLNATVSLIHIVLYLFLPIFFQFALYNDAHKLHQFTEDYQVEGIIQLLTEIRWGWVNSAVGCRWTHHAEDNTSSDSVEEEKDVAFFSSLDSSDWIIFSLDRQPTSESYASLLEAIVIQLFPCCSSIPFVSKVCKLVSNFCTTEDMVNYDPERKSFDYSRHVKHLLALSFGDEQWETKQDTRSFAAPCVWYEDLLNLFLKHPVLKKPYTVTIHFLTPLVSYVKSKNFTQLSDSLSADNETLNSDEGSFEALSNELDASFHDSTDGVRFDHESLHTTDYANINLTHQDKTLLMENLEDSVPQTFFVDEPMRPCREKRVRTKLEKDNQDPLNTDSTYDLQSTEDKTKVFRGKRPPFNHPASSVEQPVTTSTFENHTMVKLTRKSDSVELIKKDNQFLIPRSCNNLTSSFPNLDTIEYFCPNDTKSYSKIIEELPHLSSEFSKCIATGRKGEFIAYDYLYNYYREHIASKALTLCWVNQYKETGLPYDIYVTWNNTSQAEQKKIYIEVKATSSFKKCFFEVSNTEWRFAQLKGNDYFIYRIFLNGNPPYSITRVQNPYRQWREKKMKIFMSF